MAGIGSGWWLEPDRHSLARQGIKTVPIEKVQIKKQSTGRFSEIKKLPNRIQNQIQDTTKALKKLAYAQPESASARAVEAQVKYNKLRNTIREYLVTDQFPPWVEKDWVGKENWHNAGQVQKLIKNLEVYRKSNDITEAQKQLRRILEVKG